MTSATLSEFRFLRYRVKSFEFHATDETPEPHDAQWDYSIDLRRKVYAPVSHSAQDLQADDVVRVPIDLTLTVNWKPRTGPFSATITVQGVFEYDADFAEELAHRMCHYQAPALLYSQVRPLMRMHASEAGFPNFTLPLLNVAKSLKEHDEQQISTDEPSKAAERE